MYSLVVPLLLGNIDRDFTCWATLASCLNIILRISEAPVDTPDRSIQSDIWEKKRKNGSNGSVQQSCKRANRAWISPKFCDMTFSFSRFELAGWRAGLLYKTHLHILRRENYTNYKLPSFIKGNSITLHFWLHAGSSSIFSEQFSVCNNVLELSTLDINFLWRSSSGRWVNKLILVAKWSRIPGK